MPAPKPSTLPDWDTTLANLLAPSGGQIASGWANGQVVPSNWLNWWMNLVGQWQDWLNDIDVSPHTWPALQTFSAAPFAFLVSNSQANFNRSVGVATIPSTKSAAFFVGTVSPADTDPTVMVGAGFGGSSGDGLEAHPGPNGGNGVKGIADGSGVVGAAGCWGKGFLHSAGVHAEVDPGSATRAALNVLPQAAPSAPQDGDMWVETGTNTFKVRINGVTKTVTVT